MRYELDKQGYFVCDLPDGASALYWTEVPIPQPIGKPRFIDGKWVDEGEPDPVIVPLEVSMRQARLALLQTGLLDTVANTINTMEGVEGQAARIEWEYSQSIKRDAPFVLTMGGVVGLTADQIDQLFITAASL